MSGARLIAPLIALLLWAAPARAQPSIVVLAPVELGYDLGIPYQFDGNPLTDGGLAPRVRSLITALCSKTSAKTQLLVINAHADVPEAVGPISIDCAASAGVPVNAAYVDTSLKYWRKTAGLIPQPIGRDIVVGLIVAHAVRLSLPVAERDSKCPLLKLADFVSAGFNSPLNSFEFPLCSLGEVDVATVVDSRLFGEHGFEPELAATLRLMFGVNPALPRVIRTLLRASVTNAEGAKARLDLFPDLLSPANCRAVVVHEPNPAAAAGYYLRHTLRFECSLSVTRPSGEARSVRSEFIPGRKPLTLTKFSFVDARLNRELYFEVVKDGLLRRIDRIGPAANYDLVVFHPVVAPPSFLMTDSSVARVVRQTEITWLDEIFVPARDITYVPQRNERPCVSVPRDGMQIGTLDIGSQCELQMPVGGGISFRLRRIYLPTVGDIQFTPRTSSPGYTYVVEGTSCAGLNGVRLDVATRASRANEEQDLSICATN